MKLIFATRAAIIVQQIDNNKDRKRPTALQ